MASLDGSRRTARARRRRRRPGSSAENAASETSACSEVTSPRTSPAACSAAAASRRLSLSTLVSRASSFTDPLARRGATKSSSFRSMSVKPRRESTRIDDRAQAAPHREVLGHHLLPAQLGVALDGGIAIAGQVGEQRVGGQLRAELEQVDVLRPSRRLRREGETLLLRQDIDRGRLAGVGATDEGDLRQLGDGQLGERARRRQEARGVGPRERRLRGGGLVACRFSGSRRGRHGGAHGAW